MIFASKYRYTLIRFESFGKYENIQFNIFGQIQMILLKTVLANMNTNILGLTKKHKYKYKFNHYA